MQLTRRSFLGSTGAGILAAVIPQSVLASGKKQSISDISFVQLTDTHIPDTRDIEKMPRKVIDEIEAGIERTKKSYNCN